MGRGARSQARPVFRYRGRIGGRPISPPSPAQRAQLGISPLRYRRLPQTRNEAAERTNERRQLYEDAAEQLLGGLQRTSLLNTRESLIERLGLDQRGGPVVGAGGSVPETRAQLDELRRFLFAASLDPDFPSRLGNANHALGLMRQNERLLRDMAQNPAAYRLEDARDLQAIIVTEDFAEQILGRRPRGYYTLEAAPTGPRLTRADSARIRQHQDAAGAAGGGVRMPTPTMLIHPDLEIVLRHFGFVARCLPEAAR